MKRKTVSLFLFALLILTLARPIMAQGGDSFTLSRWTVNSGRTMSGGDFTLNATLGQPEAGLPASGETFTLIGGFVPAEAAAGPDDEPEQDQTIYLPMVLR